MRIIKHTHYVILSPDCQQHEQTQLDSVQSSRPNHGYNQLHDQNVRPCTTLATKNALAMTRSHNWIRFETKGANLSLQSVNQAFDHSHII